LSLSLLSVVHYGERQVRLLFPSDEECKHSCMDGRTVSMKGTPVTLPYVGRWVRRQYVPAVGNGSNDNMIRAVNIEGFVSVVAFHCIGYVSYEYCTRIPSRQPLPYVHTSTVAQCHPFRQLLVEIFECVLFCSFLFGAIRVMLSVHVDNIACLFHSSFLYQQSQSQSQSS
jgi:hypothetical protein